MKKRALNAQTQTFHGKDAIIRLGTEESGNLCATRGLTLGLTKDTIDTTTRCDAEHGYTSHASSWKTWTITTDGLFVAEAASKPILFEAYDSGEPLIATVELPDGTTFSGLVVVTSFDIEAAYDDAITFSSDLQGTGALEANFGTGLIRNSGELKAGLIQATKEGGR